MKRHVIECGIPRCRRFHLSHSWLRRTPGVLVGETWYCSHACLRDALEVQAREQQEAAAEGQRRPPRMPYRLILLRSGVVTESELEEARDLGSRAGTPGGLGERLVALGHATEEQVAEARAAEAGCAYYAAGPEWVPPACRLPLLLTHRYQAVAVRHSPGSGRLMLGFTHRIEPRLLQAAALVTGCRVQACMVTPLRYRERLGVDREHAVDRQQASLRMIEDTPQAIAAHVVSQAVRWEADQVRMARVGELLWVRLVGAKPMVELLVELSPLHSTGEAHQMPGEMEGGGVASMKAAKAARLAARRVPSSRKVGRP